MKSRASWSGLRPICWLGSIGPLATILLAVTVSPTRASSQVYLTAAQPMSDENTNCSIGYQTYMIMGGGGIPGHEILWTCTPNSVPWARGGAGSVELTRPENTNLAHQLGMTVRIEEDIYNMKFQFRSHPKGPHPRGDSESRDMGIAYVDSLTVVLDVGPAIKHVAAEWTYLEAEHRRQLLDEAVDYTVRCILVNAGRSHVEVSRLRLRILGSERYRQFEKLHEIPTRYPEAR